MLIQQSTKYSQLKGRVRGWTETHADDEMKFLSRQIQLLLVGYAEDSFGLPQKRGSSSLVRYIVRWFLINSSFFVLYTKVLNSVGKGRGYFTAHSLGNRKIYEGMKVNPNIFEQKLYHISKTVNSQYSNKYSKTKSYEFQYQSES